MKPDPAVKAEVFGKLEEMPEWVLEWMADADWKMLNSRDNSVTMEKCVYGHMPMTSEDRPKEQWHPVVLDILEHHYWIYREWVETRPDQMKGS